MIRRRTKRTKLRALKKRSFGLTVEYLERRDLLALVSWDGGAGSFEWNDAQNWSTDSLPNANDDVELLNLTPAQTVTGSLSNISAKSIRSNAKLELAGIVLTSETIEVSGLSVVNGGTVTTFPGSATDVYRLSITVTDTLTVDESSQIDVSGKGYIARRTTGNAQGELVGSYGGRGGWNSNRVYGDFRIPNDWGSGGHVSGNRGRGGGLVHIEANTFDLDGAVRANGEFLSGAGGGIYVSATRLDGQGTIAADGANSANPGGGGGRIAVYASDFGNFDLDRVHAWGGQQEGGNQHGGAGTVFVKDKDEPHGRLIIDSGEIQNGYTELGVADDETVTFTDAVEIRGANTRVRTEHAGLTLNFENTLDVRDGARLEVRGTLISQLPLTVGSGSTISVSGMFAPEETVTVTEDAVLEVRGTFSTNSDVTVDDGTIAAEDFETPTLSVINGGTVTTFPGSATDVYRLSITVTDTLTVDESSQIDVSGKGYIARRTTGNAQGELVGSYGGRGGWNSNRVYGDFRIPNDWGSGGHVSGNRGRGGGLVHIEANTFDLDGAVRANGEFLSGAGGGIYVSATRLDGQGTIAADGANSANPGGGGGRIAVYASDFGNFDLDRVHAWGGQQEGGNQHGGAGTVFVKDKDEPHGRLIIDSGEIQNGYTELGVADDETVTFTDAVEIRGANTRVRTEHAGLTLNFENTLDVRDGARLEVRGTLISQLPLTVGSGSTISVSGMFAPEETVTVTEDAVLEVRGTFSTNSDVTVDDGTIAAEDFETPTLSVINGGTVTTFPGSATDVYRLSITVTDTLTVDESSQIDVSGKGYIARRTTGNAQGELVGSYGGRGGWNSNRVYGDFRIPNDWGSGGHVSGNRGRGGGLVHIEANTFDLDGAVRANGEFLSGAGGGIYVSATRLDGQGTIAADGANSANPGGGGGRIAVYASDFGNFDLDRVHAWGGQQEGGNQHGGAGTVFVKDKDEPHGRLIIDSGEIQNGYTELGVADDETVTFTDAVEIRGANTRVRTEHAGLTLNFENTLDVRDGARLEVRGTLISQLPLTVGSGSTISVSGMFAPEETVTVTEDAVLEVRGTFSTNSDVTVDDGTIAAEDFETPTLSVINGGTVTTFPGSATDVYRLSITVTDTLTVDESSQIDVSGKGYIARRTTGNAQGELVGSYGGRGGWNSNRVYGDFRVPHDWGSGGHVFNPGNRGPGGGLVHIEANTFDLNGAVQANGELASGAGGGIHVSATRLDGQGTITANGNSSRSPGGGGGRIAVYASDFGNFDLDRVHAWGGQQEGGNQHGGAGSVHIKQGPAPTFVRSHVPKQMSAAIDLVALTFTRPIDVDQFDPSLVEINGPLENITVNDLVPVQDTTYELRFPTITDSGMYHFTISPHLLDVRGLELDDNANGVPGESDDGFAFSLLVDTVGPRVSHVSPTGDVTGTIESVDLWFSETIDANSLSLSDITLKRGKESVALSKVSPVGLNRFRVTFEPLTQVGSYEIQVSPEITDLVGNALNSDGDSEFGEPVDDVFSSSFNFVPVDLRPEIQNISPDTLLAGQAMTISWHGVNESGAELVGSWSDRFYLSKDDQWDIDDLLITTREHTNGLAEAAEYGTPITPPVPGVLPEEYYVIVRTDVFNQQLESDESTQSNEHSFGPVQVDVMPMTNEGEAFDGRLSATDPADYYAVTLKAGDTLKLRLESESDDDRTELYVSYASIPTRLRNDHRVATPTRTKEITLTGIAGGGTYYVTAYADQPSSEVNYSISAQVAPIFITDISPRHHATAIATTATITGEGFDETTIVEFVRGESSTQVPIDVVSSSTITVPNLSDFRSGVYTVRVSRAGASDELVDAFEFVDGGEPNLETRLIPPSGLSPGFAVKQTMWVEYSNTGDVAMAAPLLQVTASSRGLLTADEDLANSLRGRRRPVPNGLGNSVQLLASGSGATAGILQPGDSGRIPVYYLGLEEDERQRQVNFSLGSLTEADTTEHACQLTNPSERIVIDRPGNGKRSIDMGWDFVNERPKHAVWPFRAVRAQDPNAGTVLNRATFSGGSRGHVSTGTAPPINCFEELLRIDFNEIRSDRPATIPDAAWQAIVSNLQADVGELWADYVVEMSDNANYLATVGQETTSVADLWGFEVAQASASLNPVRYLAGAVDAAVPAPGLPLTFSRVFGNGIVSRFQNGPLGFGWSHNWDITAQRQLNGDVILRGPGGVDRFFTNNNDGTFESSPGDYGTLRSTLVRGIQGQQQVHLTLRETDGTIWQFEQGPQLQSVSDTNGNRIDLGYTDGQLISLTHTSGQQLLLEYTTLAGANRRHISRLVETLGPGTDDDRETTFEYDTTADGAHLTRVVAPDGRVTQYGYAEQTGTDPLSHALRSVAYPDGTHDFFDYDRFGRLIETKKDGDGELVQFRYLGEGNVEVVENADMIELAERVTRLGFGLGGQLAQVRDGHGRIVGFGYDNDFQFDKLNGPGGERYQYTYDGQGNLIHIRDALNLETTFEYEPNSNQLASFTDARGNGIDYQYDARGNLTAIVYADDSSETFTYDAVGNVRTATNRRGQTVTYDYNSAGQVTEKDYDTTPVDDFVYQYDSAGNLTQATVAVATADPNVFDFKTTTLQYDLQTDLLSRINYPGGQSFTFGYDEVGRRTSRTDELGNVVDYEYDAIGRLDRMFSGRVGGTDPRELIVDYGYDAAGRLTKKTLGNGVYSTYEYDEAGKLTKLHNRRPDGSILSLFEYEYDASGRRTSMTTIEGKYLYNYDALGQLVGVVHPDGRVVNYDYDETGNRRLVMDGGAVTAYTANDLNQYVAVGDVVYEYDLDGNLISKTEGGETNRYTYDVENRLVRVAIESDGWEYEYDALGNRTATAFNDEWTQYVIDPIGLGNVVAEYDSMGNVTASYEHGYGLLLRTDAMGDPAYYTFSAIGNTSELTDSRGNSLNSYLYDPFSVTVSAETISNRFEFGGEIGYSSDNSGLIFDGLRDYDGLTGRYFELGGLDTSQYDFSEYSPVSEATREYFEELSKRPLREYFEEVGRNRLQGLKTMGVALSVVYPVGRIPQLYRLGASLVPHVFQRLAPWSFHIVCAGQFAGRVRGTLCGNVGSIVGQAFQGFPSAPQFSLFSVPYTALNLLQSLLARSFDPNDKLTSAGFGDLGFIRADQSLAYTIRFENQPDATAPAQQVVITDTLDVDLDLNTFELTEIAFADQQITVPPGLDHYEVTLPIKANSVDIYVDVHAALDRETRKITLSLQAIDPETGWMPDDPLIGLLYPNTEEIAPNGEGHVSFTMRARSGVPSGTEITNRASIVFDFNDPIETPQVLNTLDAVTPTSHVLPLPESIGQTSFDVSWTGQDEENGSGIAGYDVYVSVDQGDFTPWLVNTVETSASFSAEPGRSYRYCSRARDNVGHVEPAPPIPDTQTRVVVVDQELGVSVEPLITNDATPELRGTVTDPLATVVISVHGTDYEAITSDGGQWVLPDDTITAPLSDGRYDVLVTARTTNGLVAQDASSDELLIDTRPPTVAIESTPSTVVAGEVDEIRFTFSEPVNGFDLSDLTLTRSTDQIVSLLPDAAILTMLDDAGWRLGNIASLTSPSGIYELILSGLESNITDVAGNRLASSAVNSWINRPGDANEDGRFDQLDLVQVLQFDLYNTGQPASWRSGDWSGNGVFDQFDIITALQSGQYLSAALGAKVPMCSSSHSKVESRLNGEHVVSHPPEVANVDSRVADHLFKRLGI